jgi:hypothetical protein
MPPYPRRDYSIPQPSGLSPLGTDGKRVPFPSIKRSTQVQRERVSNMKPRPDLTARGGSPTPREMQRRPLPPTGERVPYRNPRWPTGIKTVTER